MTVEQLKDKMRAEGMDPDQAKFTVSADGSVDIIDQPNEPSKQAIPHLTSSKK